MAKLTKRQKAIREKVEAGKLYAIDEAVSLLKEVSAVKFPETIDVAINLGVDARKSDQVVRGATTLPHGTGKTVRVAVFTQGDNAEKAKAAGADIVGMEDLAEQAVEDLLDIEGLDSERAGQLIMTARAPWFADEETSGDAQ